ncbi:uncharacterized protein [Palaemon carinicauda]|uniref:uncharacterized protein n=1 Tax=Palaemon carinicauda TaxID=392227 RepID=UPI0035B693ED
MRNEALEIRDSSSFLIYTALQEEEKIHSERLDNRTNEEFQRQDTETAKVNVIREKQVVICGNVLQLPIITSIADVMADRMRILGLLLFLLILGTVMSLSLSNGLKQNGPVFVEANTRGDFADMLPVTYTKVKKGGKGDVAVLEDRPKAATRENSWRVSPTKPFLKRTTVDYSPDSFCYATYLGGISKKDILYDSSHLKEKKKNVLHFHPTPKGRSKRTTLINLEKIKLDKTLSYNEKLGDIPEPSRELHYYIISEYNANNNISKHAMFQTDKIGFQDANMKFGSNEPKILGDNLVFKGKQISQSEKETENIELLHTNMEKQTWEYVTAITETVKTLRITHLHLVFETEPDTSLLNSLWQQTISFEVLKVNHWWTRIRSLTYIEHSQHVLVGSLNWITNIMKEVLDFVFSVRDLYISSNVHAMNTHWIWVLSKPLYRDVQPETSESVPSSFAEAMDQVTENLREGMRGVLVAQENERKSIYSIKEDGHRVYKSWIKIAAIDARGDGTWFLSLAAVWKFGKLEMFKPFWPSPSLNLRNRTKPMVFEYVDGEGLDTASGYIIDLLHVIRNRLNFTDVLVPTRGFGLQQPNGSYDGMVGVLQRKEADMAALDFTPNHDRTSVVEFSRPIGEDIVVIISRAPNIILRPFLLLQIYSPLSWASILGTAIIAGLVLELLVSAEGWFRPSFSRTSNLFSQLTSVLKIFVNQSCSQMPSGSASRLVATTGMLMSVVIVSLYRGSITAFLAIPFRSVPINSIEDIVRGNTRPALRSKTLVYATLSAEGGALYVDRERVGVFSDAELSSWAFFQTVADGTYALVDVYSSAVGRANMYEARGARCQFHLGREPVKTDLDAFIYVKNSPIIWQVDFTIKWLQYFGIIQNIKQKYYNVPCEAEIPSDGPKPLSITQAQGALYVLAFGLMLSLGVLLIEISWARIVSQRFSGYPH